MACIGAMTMTLPPTARHLGAVRLLELLAETLAQVPNTESIYRRVVLGAPPFRNRHFTYEFRNFGHVGPL
jgi:hypothetical protein